MSKVIPGSGAVVTANFNGSYGVSSFTIVNGGTGYASTNPPKIVISNTQTPTVEGSFYPIIASGEIKSIKVLSSGSGYTPLVAAAQTAVGIASLGTNQNISAVLVSNPGVGYTLPPSVTIQAPSVLVGVGTYLFNETVTGELSGTTARVKYWDQDTKQLKVSFVTNVSKTGFYPGEVLVGSISSARYSVNTFTQWDLYDKYGENKPIEDEADGIIDFTEKNPFGSF